LKNQRRGAKGSLKSKRPEEKQLKKDRQQKVKGKPLTKKEKAKSGLQCSRIEKDQLPTAP